MLRKLPSALLKTVTIETAAVTHTKLVEGFLRTHLPLFEN